jgi:hypothetical protein
VKTDISPEDWRRLAPLLDEALDLPEAEQRTFLEAGCNGDLRLLRISFDILALGQGPDGILDTPALSKPSQDLADAIAEQDAGDASDLGSTSPPRSRPPAE